MQEKQGQLQLSEGGGHPSVAFVHFVGQLEEQTVLREALARLERQQWLNPNIILYLLWSSRSQMGRFRKVDFAQLDAVIRPWHTKVIDSLQALSEVMTPETSIRLFHLQRDVDAELKMANHVEQKLIVEGCPRQPLRARSATQLMSDTCLNVVGYCDYRKVVLEPEDKQALLILLQRLFPEASAIEINTHFEDALNDMKLKQIAPAQLALKV